MKKKLLWVITLALFGLLCGCSGGHSTTAPHSISGAPAPSSSAAAAAAPSENFFSTESGTSGESYLSIPQNKEITTQENTMCTFSLKVDTASYSNIQRYIESGTLPPPDAVRTEELLNYFSYDAPVPAAVDGQPFSVYTEIAPSPFDPQKYLAFLRVKTPSIDRRDLPPSNLTFLIDTSGSMESYDKLPLLRQAFSMLAETLNEKDRVSIVTYAGSASILLDGCPGNNSRQIMAALDSLISSGSTGGAEGIQTAYKLAKSNFLPNGNNRVILATDGDFNVGPSSNEALSALVSEKRESGIYLSILGFGTGNLRDDLMETLSKDGNGNYAYINSLHTAQKVLVEELSSSLYTVANDVKAQVEFNPANVASYRLIGYENRALRNEDFANDKKDAGEIGVGTDVVILFELTLQGTSPRASAMKYQQSQTPSGSAAPDMPYEDELLEMRIRYKDPESTESKLVTTPVRRTDLRERGSSDLQFAAAVAQFGELLRGSQNLLAKNTNEISALAKDHLGNDSGGYRTAFLSLLEQYQSLT